MPYKRVLHRFWGPMFQMDVSKLPEGVSLEEAKKIYPYKMWFYDGQQSDDSPMIHAINVQANQKDLSAIFELFRRFADEETSLPSYTHGEQTQNLNKTASGMSMLMTAANVSTKSVVKNVDDYMTSGLEF